MHGADERRSQAQPLAPLRRALLRGGAGRAQGLRGAEPGIVAARLRTTNELYREAVAFGIEATGAHTLNLKTMAEDLRQVTLHLSGDTSVSGRILQMDHHAAGYTVVLKLEDDKLTMVPYHAIQRIDLN
jgi:hypothetical protein